ncbi:protein-export chaperone SecB [Clostridium perfringens]|uniref:protein-export chaperone SecB n=1 Tax=Clostridium perfringens TaxID=1502 RepID=UPI002245A524|nr:protein-export chaperone SecB [Clostridium perfringens]MCX0390998.1 protein-export chaperone SecB [Clostridium perfringens]
MSRVGGQDKNCVLSLHDVYTEEIILERKDNYSKKDSELSFNIGYSFNEGFDDTFKITIRVKINDTKNDSLNLSISVSGIFEYKNNNELKLTKNAIAILFPYVRSSLTNITAQSGLEPLILPTINFNALLEAKKDEIDD